MGSLSIVSLAVLLVLQVFAEECPSVFLHDLGRGVPFSMASGPPAGSSARASGCKIASNYNKFVKVELRWVMRKLIVDLDSSEI